MVSLNALVPGRLADLAVLSADCFSVPEEEIKRLESVLTTLGGKVVHASAEFRELAPPPLPVMPQRSPVEKRRLRALAGRRGGLRLRRDLSRSAASLSARPGRRATGRGRAS